MSRCQLPACGAAAVMVAPVRLLAKGLGSLSVPSIVMLLAVLLAPCSCAQQHTRGLRAYPMALPPPFASPDKLAAATRLARSQRAVGAFADKMCSTFAQPGVQGTRAFFDVDGVLLWPMFQALSRGAVVYGQDYVQDWGKVLARCNSMGGLAAEGVGFGIAFIFAEGPIESLGLTRILQEAYGQTGSCASINKIMDVAAAVITSRDVAPNELHNAMQTYDARLAVCTPKDGAAKFKATSIKAAPPRMFDNAGR